MSDSRHEPPPDTLLPSMSLDRTLLANERTLLAYVRTSLAFLIAGVSAIHFLSSTAAAVVGVLLILLGAATLLAGVRSYWRMRGRARRAQRQLRARASGEQPAGSAKS